MPKNYYFVLGVPSDSSQGDIKAAYRRLAKEFHPDRYGKNQRPFQVIQEAYSVLSDPNSRKSYDSSLYSEQPLVPKYRANQRWKSDEVVEPLIPDDQGPIESMTSLDRLHPGGGSIFEEIFDQYLSNVSDRPTTVFEKLDNMSLEITLSPTQAQMGGNVRLNLPIQRCCPSCYPPNHRHGSFRHSCWRCNGTGIISGEKPILINYPAGISNNHSMKIAIKEFGTQQLYLNIIFKI